MAEAWWVQVIMTRMSCPSRRGKICMNSGNKMSDCEVKSCPLKVEVT